MGTILYEHDHPGELAGLVLLAPFMGDAKLLVEIDDAGGIGDWDPGKKPETVNGDNYQRELWRTVKDWSGDRDLARRVWMACGSDDDLLAAAKQIARVLPPGHFVEPAGGHLWKVWDPAATELLQRIAKAR